jgi:hypothetical protein
VQELRVPRVRVLAVSGDEPPGSAQYRDAIATLYGIGYSLRMGLKFGKLPRPAGYFDYQVGALETLWWSTGKVFEIANPKTVRWQAFLMVPSFVSNRLVEAARSLAKAKHPELPYERAALTTLAEGRSVQVLHVGPYHAEQPAIDRLHAYMTDHGLVASGKHHEIYLSDPGKTRPERLRTVIRIPVKRASRRETARG